MKSWMMYFKKDQSQMKIEILFALASVAAFEVLGLILLAYEKVTVEAEQYLSLWILGCYLPVYMAISLAKERNNAASLWIIFPERGWRLLLSKLTAGVLSFVTVCCVSILFSCVTIMLYEASWELLLNKALWCLGMLDLGFGLALLLVFTFIVINAANQFFPKGQGVISVLLFIGLFAGIIYLVTTDLYQSLFTWGNFSAAVVLGLPESGVPELYSDLYAGDYLFSFIFNVCLFIISGWLLDKKVEV